MNPAIIAMKDALRELTPERLVSMPAVELAECMALVEQLVERVLREALRRDPTVSSTVITISNEPAPLRERTDAELDELAAVIAARVRRNLRDD
jgi:hypothetical protein